jgi:hypothetical protein
MSSPTSMQPADPNPFPLVGEVAPQGSEGGGASQKRSRSERVMASTIQTVGAIPPSPTLPHKGGEGLSAGGGRAEQCHRGSFQR